ncbi:GNAT family N-acetyltransferase [Salipaludibacillus keqinensis]|uniref:GNAT family N-acetyltransferase n=1 Tax=Salipaludibacillus keqinensis TaxID=2045207 RepID=A0A323TDC5_9BACI|nr:GNAT family N-acetyltransferase [Salipaludibacillus keqinensis]PYZ93382.1 GNAT family N-acetyltransferase [Salipaludibacillus keqinensis]
MIYEADRQVKNKLNPMFESMDDTIIFSCLQGHLGTAWVDDLENPSVAQIIVGIFVIYAGDPHTKEAEEMVRNLPEFALVIGETDEWKQLIETVHQDSAEKFQRYRFEKNPDHLDRTHIQNIISPLPEGYEMKKIDKAIANEPSLHKVSEDFISQFDSVEDFLARGTGFAVVKDGKVVCGATSYSIYDEGIEIEVATHPDHRGKGLATITSATLIEDCLDKGLYPSWDAANETSVHMAKKFGYKFKESYDTYCIERSS